MMRAALLAACMLTSPALALDLPSPGRLDQNVRTVDYIQGQRWQVVGDLNRITTFTFGENERVARVMFGENGLWAGPKPEDLKENPLRNSVPLQPVSTKPTNMVIYTWLSDGRERVYQFALRANDVAPDATDLEATYGLIFTYNAVERGERNKDAVSRQREQADNRDENIAKARQDTSAFYGVTNWKYTAQGDSDLGDFAICPTEVSDNGSTTRFRFPGNLGHPSIFKIAADGSEQTAAVFPMDDFILTYGTARVWIVRQGANVVRITNRAYDAIGVNPRTGTTSPDVIRTIRAAK